jgi:hypothetical protein
MLALVPCFTQGAIMLSRMSLGEIRAVLAWMGAKLLLGVGIALIAAAFGAALALIRITAPQIMPWLRGDYA